MPLVLTSSSALALLSFPTCSSSWRVPWLWVFFRPAPLESGCLLSFDLRPYLVFFFTCLFLFWLLCVAVVLRKMPILFPCTRSLPAGCCPQQRWTTVLWFTSKAPGLRSLRLGLSRRQEGKSKSPSVTPGQRRVHLRESSDEPGSRQHGFFCHGTHPLVQPLLAKEVLSDPKV